MAEELEEILDPVHSDDDSKAPISHNKLLGAVAELYEKKRVKAPTRKEPSLEVSEFHLSQPVKKHSRIKVTDLANALKNRTVHTQISQKLKSARKRAKTLPKPLEKVHSDRISRAAGYENAKRQLNRWDAIVYQHKVAEHISFPLQNESVKVYGETDVSKLFRKPNALEIKLGEIIREENKLEEKKKPEEEKEEYPLTLDEVIEKRKMMAKLRAQESYRQAKAARHSKIKSKKFHQIQRRARVKEQLREFEELQKKDPEAALKKLEELERTRAEERMTLRHRSTGQWAKNLSVRAKYDKDARIALAEQLSKSRELTVKVNLNRESESEKEDEEAVNPEPAEEDPNNPWVVKRSKEMENFVSGYRKYWENEGKNMNKTPDTAVKVAVESSKVMEDEESSEQQIFKGKRIEPSSKKSLHNVEKDDNNISCVKENVKNLSTKQNSFIVKDTTNKISQLKSKKNKSGVLFEISNSPGAKLKNVTSSSECNKSENDFKANKKINPKSGSWAVSEVSKNTSMQPKSRKAYGKNLQIVKSSNMSFQVTDSTQAARKTCSLSHQKRENQEIKFKESETRKQINKSLDELFEEAEDKLHDKIKAKVGKIKQSLDRKRKNSSESDSGDETEEIPSLQFKKIKTLADIDEELIENTGNSVSESLNHKSVSKLFSAASTEPKTSVDIDPNKYLKVTPRKIISTLPDIMTEGDDALDDEEEKDKNRHLTISEAFAEDDVVDQFQREKEEEIKKSNIGDVDLSLPGWGSWAGHNMKPVSRRKRKKFVIKIPRVIPRRDSNRGNVIINEDADKPIKEHKISELPYPFTSVRDFEASIRAPLGTTWMPQIAHKKLTQPPVTTKMGAIIRPMDESQLIKRDKPTNTPTQQKRVRQKQNKAKN